MIGIEKVTESLWESTESMNIQSKGNKCLFTQTDFFLSDFRFLSHLEDTEVDLRMILDAEN